MMDPQQRQTVLVTGAGRGIGEAIARRFILAGHDVVLNHRKSQGKGAAGIERLVALAAQQGTRAIPALADIAEPADVEKMFRTLRAEDGVERIDHLVLNAATTPFKNLTDMTRNDWKGLLGTNLVGNIACVTHAVPLMHRGSTVCAISSLGSLRPLPQYPLGVMKSAVEQMVRYLEIELASRGIRVNGVCAGFVNTDVLPVLRELWPAIFAHQAQSGRRFILEPDEVAEIVHFLASPASSAIRGEIVVADLGVSLCI